MKYPWQAKQWQQLWQAKQSDRLPHALLLAGIAGTGKAGFALHTTQALLCKQVNEIGEPCHECHSCRLITGYTHPNVYWVTPEKEGQAIKVDQVREVSEFVQQSSLQGEFRVVLINPAHSMNINASNALLKTLEEPASGAIIILISDQSGHLPATVRSRCQRILFPKPNESAALAWLNNQELDSKMKPEQWLRLANGAPLLAVALQDNEVMLVREEVYTALHLLIANESNPVKLAAKWQKMEPTKWLNLFLTWILDIVRLQLGGDTSHLINQDYEKQLHEAAKRAPLQRNLDIAQALIRAREQMSAGINFNKQLFIESMLINWSEQSR